MSVVKNNDPVQFHGGQHSGNQAVLSPIESTQAHVTCLVPVHAFKWVSLDSEKSRSEVYQKLCANRHSFQTLAKEKYRMDPYMRLSDLKKHRKCIRCSQKGKGTKPNDRCNYHVDPTCQEAPSGRKYYSCCRRLAPCKTAPEHKWEEITPEFESRFASFIEAPEQEMNSTKRKAVVVDCEMVGVSDGFQELARLCAVDYLTGEILIYSFVDPVEKVVDYRTLYSGVTAENLATAKENGNCLSNWSAARDALLQFIDTETIVIGSALQNDLEILRLVHTNVVDSSIIAYKKVGQRLGVKTLCEKMLNLDIRPEGKSHDPLEDCLATREIVLWMTCFGKSKFDEWVIITKQKIEEEQERHRQRQIDQRNKIENKSRKVVGTEFITETGVGGLSDWQRALREAYYE